ncbi:hypothetical protein K435DRAFT_800350 [Dendrothele bispora CBS 962.96]|uniref:Alpha/beta-hydrolase n=1 Tax=Dendrothele bispora (strain CBS 962.96) TaxID=1314807 RepID=A0A4V4HEW0_DENBC|nr:hypothetical protein K435DRAFT_800350 [Dendrothele bispora CBS 962.96]
MEDLDVRLQSDFLSSLVRPYAFLSIQNTSHWLIFLCFLGPCRVPGDTGAKFHPESWNTNAKIFSVDQPIGFGFLYTDYGENTWAVPLFASQAYDQNTRMVEAGLTPINPTSIMIVSQLHVLDIKTCVAMKQMSINACFAVFNFLVAKDGLSHPASINMTLSIVVLQQRFLRARLLHLSGGQAEWKSFVIPSFGKHMPKYLSLPFIRTKLGVDLSPSVPTNFSSCFYTVGPAFNLAQDVLLSLLERGWTLVLERSGQRVFSEKELKEWEVEGSRAGMARRFSQEGGSDGGRLTFTTVEGAGHMGSV